MNNENNDLEAILQGLNQEQYDGVTTTDGPVLILAGAGSGKTKVLTHRIAYILKTKSIGYENILAVTFTNKAAKEMKERISKLLGYEYNNDNYLSRSLLPFMGTFHSICVKILRADGEKVGVNSNFAIYDSGEQQDVIKEILKQQNISPKDFSPNAILSAISTGKNELRNPREFEKYAQGYFLQTVANVYYEYEKALIKNNALDFDDLIMRTSELFQKDPEVLRRYQELFQYILVDEYQDTNHAQYMFAKQLSALHRNICVVGDPDQSIYSFRGADISNILSFETDYPEAKIIKLEQNYRSTKTILDAAQNVIEKNKNRKDKRLISNKGDGSPITVYEALNEGDESRFVSLKIQDFLRQNSNIEKPLNHVAVLYRTNAQSRNIEEQMLRDRLPYTLVGGLRFYDRKEIKDLLSYLRIIYNSSDDSSLKRVINTPVRGIGPKAYSDLLKVSIKNNMSGINMLLLIADMVDEEIKEIKAEDPELAKIAINPHIKNFALLLKAFFEKSQDVPPAETLEYILEKTSYIDYIDDKTEEADSRKENIKELFTVAEKYSELDPSVGLAEFLTDVALVEQESKNMEGDAQGAVTLMTIHAAKGLEFDETFVIGMEEGLFPHSRVFLDPSELEEERRLCYVAITRAKTQLHLVYATQRMIYGKISSNPASRFLADIPEHLITFTTGSRMTVGNSQKNRFSDFDDEFSDFNKKSFSFGNVSIGTKNKSFGEQKDSFSDDTADEYLEIGDKVKHELFGFGEILAADANIITVRFQGVGVKKLSKEFAKLKKA